MIERILFNAIQNGIERLTADPSIIEDMFVEIHGLEASEAAKIRAHWEEHIPDLHHGYARTDSDFPGFFIVLTGENEAQHWLGEEPAQFLDDPADNRYGAPINGSIWKSNFNVLVYAQNPDECLYYYQILKFILIQQDAYLKECGLLFVHYNGGDMAPDQSWMPAGLFLRRFTLDVQSEYNQITPDGVGRAWKVAGIHIDASGAPGEDVGGVQTLITVTDPREEIEDGS